VTAISAAAMSIDSAMSLVKAMNMFGFIYGGVGPDMDVCHEKERL